MLCAIVRINTCTLMNKYTTDLSEDTYSRTVFRLWVTCESYHVITLLAVNISKKHLNEEITKRKQKEQDVITMTSRTFERTHANHVSTQPAE